MCRFLAYSGEPIILASLLLQPKRSLIAQSLAAREAKTITNADGCGVGWFGEFTEPGLYRGVLPAWSDANLASLCRQIRARQFLAHVRSATSGEVTTANCHPFTAGRHLFMHNGQIGNYDRLRRHIDMMIPDASYSLRQGTSDSEAIFLIAWSDRFEADPIGALARTLAGICTTIKAAGGSKALRFAAAHGDGDSLFAYRWASDGRPPSLYWRRLSGGIVVASEPFDADTSAWTAMPAASVLQAKRNGEVEVRSFEIPAVPTRR